MFYLVRQVLADLDEQCVGLGSLALIIEAGDTLVEVPFVPFKRPQVLRKPGLFKLLSPARSPRWSSAAAPGCCTAPSPPSRQSGLSVSTAVAVHTRGPPDSRLGHAHLGEPTPDFRRPAPADLPVVFGRASSLPARAATFAAGGQAGPGLRTPRRWPPGPPFSAAGPRPSEGSLCSRQLRTRVGCCPGSPRGRGVAVERAVLSLLGEGQITGLPPSRSRPARPGACPPLPELRGGRVISPRRRAAFE